jgi:hypothetical protein
MNDNDRRLRDCSRALNKLFSGTEDKEEQERRKQQEQERQKVNEQISNWTPSVAFTFSNDTAYATMLVGLKKCSICGKWMIAEPNQTSLHRTFPWGMSISFTTQVKRAGWVIASGVEDSARKEICVECRDAGKLRLKCIHCQQMITSDQVKESFGEPPDYLCNNCYETMPAKKWNELVEELESLHKYDYE